MYELGGVAHEEKQIFTVYKIHVGYLSVDSPDNAGYIYSIIISDDIQTTQTLIAQLVIHDNYLFDV